MRYQNAYKSFLRTKRTFLFINQVSTLLCLPIQRCSLWLTQSQYTVHEGLNDNIDFSQIQQLEKIEKGSFGEIFKASWRGTIVALKKIPSANLTTQLIKELKREAALMKYTIKSEMETLVAHLLNAGSYDILMYCSSWVLRQTRGITISLLSWSSCREGLCTESYITRMLTYHWRESEVSLKMPREAWTTCTAWHRRLSTEISNHITSS